MELFQHIGQLCDPERSSERTYVLPVPCTNQVNGGVHSGNPLAPQGESARKLKSLTHPEFMLLPVGAKNFEEAMKIATECYHALKAVISDKFGIAGDFHPVYSVNIVGTGVGDEGGFAPPVKSSEEALDLLVEATAKAGHTDTVRFAIDPASSEFFDTLTSTYDLDFKSTSREDHRKLTSDQMGDLYRSLIAKYPIVLLEDPFAEDDWESWTKFKAADGGRTELVGDDLLCTNTAIVKKAVEREACDSMLLKVRQLLLSADCARSIKLGLSPKRLKRESCRHAGLTLQDHIRVQLGMVRLCITPQRGND